MQDEEETLELRALLGERHSSVFMNLLHRVVRPSPLVQAELDQLWKDRFNGAFVIGMAIRVGNIKGDDAQLLDARTIVKIAECAKETMPPGRNAAFLLLTDTPTLVLPLVNQVVEADIVTLPGPIEHFGWTTSEAALQKMFLEWFAFTKVDDAVIGWTTSFSLTALTSLAAPPSSLLPVTVDFRVREPQCLRQTWDLRQFQMFGARPFDDLEHQLASAARSHT